MYRRPYSHVIHLINQTTTEVSRNNEKRLVRAFNEEYPYEDRPNWLRSVRLATQDEDVRKIDVVFETSDVGDIHLQVKSSHTGVRLFQGEQLNGHANKNILTVIMKPFFDAKVIFARVMPLVSGEHKRRLKLAETIRENH